MKWPSDKYSGDPDAVVGLLALLEGSTAQEEGGPAIEEQGRAG